VVDRQKRLVVEGRSRAQARGELPPEPDPESASRTVDLIFDMVAGAVVHRTLVSGQPADPAWVSNFTTLLMSGLAQGSSSVR
jgi:hypothetical protein